MNTTNNDTRLMMEVTAQIARDVESLRGLLSKIAGGDDVSFNTQSACADLDEVLSRTRAQLVSRSFKVLESVYPKPPERGDEWKDSTQ